MSISGHKTRNAFNRHNIVIDQDLKEAAKQKQVYHEKLNEAVKPLQDSWGETIPFKRAKNE